MGRIKPIYVYVYQSYTYCCWSLWGVVWSVDDWVAAAGSSVRATGSVSTSVSGISCLGSTSSSLDTSRWLSLTSVTSVDVVERAKLALVLIFRPDLRETNACKGWKKINQTDAHLWLVGEGHSCGKLWCHCKETIDHYV